MSSELDDLYQEVILDHGRRPRNFRIIPDADRKAEGLNPLCGDHFKLYVKLAGDRIEDIAFEGSGCAISKASASLMTRYGIPATARASLGIYNTRAEIDALSAALEKVRRMFA